MNTTQSTWNCPDCGLPVDEPRLRGPHVSGCRRTMGARYRYLDGDNKHPYEFKACQGCGEKSWIQIRRDFCSRECSRTGVFNPGWKGEDAGYGAFHQRVYRARGKADHCSVCGEDSLWYRYEWANLTGDYADIDDYAPMCKMCHTDYDNSRRPDSGRPVYTDDLLDRAESLRRTHSLRTTAQLLGVDVSNLCSYLSKRRRSKEITK